MDAVTPTDRDPHPTRLWRVPALSQQRVVAGVAAGVADELGLDPFVVRAAFIVLALAGGFGVLLYGMAWAVMRAGAFSGGDVSTRVPKAANGAERLLGFGAVVLGLVLFARWVDIGFIDSLVWPVALFGAGAAVAREQGVDFGAEWLTGSQADRTRFAVRMAAGLALVVAAVVLAVSLNFSVSETGDTLVVLGVMVAGLALVLAPWATSLVRDLTQERLARIRADERAEVAAHLHDSVLQTLSLIQRRADDPEVVQLARRQERELRGWLYGRRSDEGDGSFAALLEAELAEVEELHAVPVEVVVVGDGPMNEARRALLAAAREAVTNAAVHSGAGRVDVFAEVRGRAVDLFVRDTGRGFDPAAVSADRRGIAESIRGRIDRVGGRVEVTSVVGEGTEVEIHLESGES